MIDYFRHERLMMICHPAYPLAGCRTVSMSGLAGQRFLGLDGNPRVALPEKHSQPPAPAVCPRRRIPRAEVVKCRVERGAGIAILPEIIVRREVDAGRLVAVPFADAGCTEPLAVIYRQDQKLTPLMESLSRH